MRRARRNVGGMTPALRFLAAGLLLALFACAPLSSSRNAALPATMVTTAGVPAGKYIKHIVVVVQENRSFNMIFAGFPGAVTATSGLNSLGQTIPLTPISFKDPRGDMGHEFNTAVNSWDGGKMDRFNENFISLTSSPAKTYPYSYLKHDEVEPYWDMAKEYVLADDMFPTEWGPSYTAHQDLIAGTTELTQRSAVADNPTTEGDWGCGAPLGTVTDRAVMPPGGEGPGIVKHDAGPFPCYRYATLANVLDAKHISWRYYAPKIGDNVAGNVWTAFSAIRAVYRGPDWKNVVSPPKTVLTDVSSDRLPAVSWVIPDFKNSDHPAAMSTTGPSWVASVVNAIGKGPYWKSTAIIVLWDDWGGWYDNVPPPQLDYLGLGIRVGCIIISPYAQTGIVDHTQYEYGSILKTVELTFGLDSLGDTDARANDMFDAFDFTSPPRAFTPIPQVYPANFFLRQAPSLRPPDSE
jgi:phospholipase C